MVDDRVAAQRKNREATGSAPAKVAAELNSLIQLQGEDAQLEPGKAIPADGKPNKLNPAYIDETLAAHYSHYEVGAGEAHERLYRLLGRIFEWGPELKSDPTLEAAIVALIKERHGQSVKAGKTGEELLLMLAVGFGKKRNVSRSQWNKALRAAEQKGVPRNAYDLTEWLREKGVISAGALYRSPDDRTPKKFDAAAYLNQIAADGPVPTMDLPESVLAAAGDHLLIIGRAVDGGDIEVLASTSDPDAVALAAKHHKAKSERLDKLIWDLNRFAMREAGISFVGKKSASDAKAFARAANELIADATVRGRYFDADAKPLEVPEKPLANHSFPVFNPSFNIYDPARYISGAKQGALLPYVPDEMRWGKLSELEQLESASRGYLDKHRKKPEPDEVRKARASRIYDLRLQQAKVREQEEARNAKRELEDV